jgi:RNA polymerase sigma-70 factor (ECF subfamily)
MKKRERIQPYLQRLYGYAVSLARDPDQAEDLVQECAVRAISAANTPRDEHAYQC